SSSNQQDMYVAGSENHPPMLNKDNYVTWSSRLLRYAQSKLNRKLIYNFTINGPYVRRMIPKLGDPDHDVPGTDQSSSNQQDMYVAGSENHPPMLNKDNYVPWSSRLLRYAKSKLNRKLIYNFTINGPYVRRMIPKLGDPDHDVPVAETFHE
nr:hypothetical protein [Tanacetum cinerariifolium]